jgi:hypothetical protein
MALLLREALDAGAPPAMARLPMTPEEVAAAYDAAEAAEDAAAGRTAAGRSPASGRSPAAAGRSPAGHASGAASVPAGEVGRN